MATYAILNSQNEVINIIKGADERTLDDGTIGTEDRTTHWEQVYANMYNENCKRTSINTRANAHRNGGTAYRKNAAVIGGEYYASHDGFAAPKPYTSWTLNTTTLLWEAPVDYPTDGNTYEWNETDQRWDQIT